MMKLRHARLAFRNLAPAILAGVIVFGAAMGTFVVAWGWRHLLADFWPLDSSRVGPNLCASIFLVVLVIAHNEARAVQLAEEHHESIRTATKKAIEQALHPAESAEAATAADVVAAQSEEPT